MKHTPGPWRVVKQIVDCTFIVANTKIADVYSTVFRDLENEQANARLIAAAPELLEAVRELRDGLPAECDCHESYREREKNLGYRFKDPNCLYCDMEDEIKQAESAIAKAEAK